MTLSVGSAGTSTFTLADNNLTVSATDTLDGNLDPLDALLVSSSFSITAVNAAVPEPSSVTLALTAAALLAVRGRRARGPAD